MSRIMILDQTAGRAKGRAGKASPRAAMSAASAEMKIAIGEAAASDAIEAARGAAAILRTIRECSMDIADTIGIPAIFIAKRLELTASTLEDAEADADWDVRPDAREEASHALRGAAGLVSLLQTGRGPDCMYGEALVQIENELLDRSRELLDRSRALFDAA